MTSLKAHLERLAANHDSVMSAAKSAFINDSTLAGDIWATFGAGVRYEQERLAPLIARLIDVSVAADQATSCLAEFEPQDGTYCGEYIDALDTALARLKDLAHE